MHVAHRARYSIAPAAAARALVSGFSRTNLRETEVRISVMGEIRNSMLVRLAALVTFAIGMYSAPVAVHAQSFAVGGYHNCAISTTGGVVCWGANDNGQIGDGTTINRSRPTNVSGLPFGSTAIAAGHGIVGHTCAVTSTGGVKCWGGNGNGQLGDNSTTQRLTPVDVSGLSGIARVTAGDQFSCALSTTGGIQCWGKNNNGRLGDGTAPPNGSAPNQLTPVGVVGFGAMAGATDLAGSYGHACAVTSTGGVKCWGNNFGSQLGDGTIVDFQNAPVNVTGLSSGVVAVAAGSDHSCALTTTGGVKCWGDNFYGAIGNGTTPGAIIPAPVDVSGLTSGVAAITAGQFHTCALTTGGGVKCWGNNSQGQIGDGTNTLRNAPVDVIASGVIAVAAGVAHTCALAATGVSTCWGANPQGQLGNGVTGGPSFSPVSTIYPTSTTTMLVSSLNPSVFGDSVTFTATVTGGVNGTPVAFQNAGVNIGGCGAQLLASGTATCTTNALGGGTQSIAAIYQGTATTLASSSATLSQVVNKADQTITFDALADKIDTDMNFTVVASASSGIAVTFTSLTISVCTVSGSIVDILIAGVCTIAANQAGNANYNAAPQVSQSFTVASSGPALALTAVLSRKTHGAAGTFEIPINTSVLIGGAVSVESRTIGSGHKIIFQYNIPITSTGTATVVDAMAAPVGSTVASSGNEVVVTIASLPNNKRVTVSLNNVNGLGGTQTASMGFLIGDASNDRAVNVIDVNAVRARSGQPVTVTNFRFDFDVSGSINVIDVNAVRARSGTTLL